MSVAVVSASLPIQQVSVRNVQQDRKCRGACVAQSVKSLPSGPGSWDRDQAPRLASLLSRESASPAALPSPAHRLMLSPAGALSLSISNK